MKRTIVIALIVVCMVFGVVAYASAANSATGTVNVSVTPNAAITLSLGAPVGGIAFGTIEPETSTSATAYSVVVKSNKAWSFTKTITSPAGMNLTSTLLNSVGKTGALGTTSWMDTVSVNVAFDAPEGTALSGSVRYDVAQ